MMTGVSWKQERESLWAQRERFNGESLQYLPPQLYNEAYALDECGRWERVYYHVLKRGCSVFAKNSHRTTKRQEVKGIRERI